MLILAVAVAVFGFAYLSFRRWSNAGEIGRMLFGVLSGFGFFYALLTGPLATVDCISRERREGTLGLLFLTDLKSYDVVLGKMAAASFGVVIGLTAALPVAAIPLLMGGVTLEQLTTVVLGVLNVMFLSLSIGVGASAPFRSGRASLAATIAVLALLTFVVPMLGEGVFHVGLSSPEAPWFYLFCPWYTMYQSLFGGLVGPPTPRWYYWLNMGGLQTLAWFCLTIACIRTATSWRDLPASARWLRWSTRLERWNKGSARARSAWRNLTLERNPVAWLEGRDRLQPRLLWAIILLCAGFLLITHLLWPESWPDRDLMDTWPFIANPILCLWVAIQSPRRLADDKQSGALELLLCTPITPCNIVRGGMMSLRRRFGRALLALLAFDAFLIYAYFEVNGGWAEFRKDEWFRRSLGAAVVFPLQAWSMARVGLYQGLVSANSLRATFMTIWKVGLLPIGMWVVFMMTCDILGLLRNQSDTFSYWALTGAHVLPCALFLAHASWRLRWRFRALAAQSARPPWWRRWLDEHRRPKLRN